MAQVEQPPNRWKRLARWLCHPDLSEEIMGDLDESYQENLGRNGRKQADSQYRREVLLLIRPSVIKNIRLPSWVDVSPGVLHSYVKSGLRTMRRHRLFTAINLIGLAASMSIGLVLIAMIGDLMRFDKFHQNRHRIYRVTTLHRTSDQSVTERATCPAPLASRIRDDVPGIKDVTLIHRHFNEEAHLAQNRLWMSGHFSDASFFRIFDFPLIAGDSATALNDPFSMVVTQTTATKLFGSSDPIGQQVTMGLLGDFTITGVMKDIPHHSHLQFDMLGSNASLPYLEQQKLKSATINDWEVFTQNYVYLLADVHTSPNDITSALGEIAQVQFPEGRPVGAQFNLQALTDIIPGKDLSDQMGAKMSWWQVYIPVLLCLLILLSACFNYTNLSIARALRRAREVGIRKVVGASRRQVFAQFIIEAVLISVAALVLAFLLFLWIRPYYLELVPRAAEMTPLRTEWQHFISFLAFAIGVGILAGAIPAAVLSRLEPAQVLRKLTVTRLMGNLSVRKGLIVFQFVLALIFLTGISIIYQQYKFVIDHDMGFSQGNTLNIWTYDHDPKIVANEIAVLPGVGMTGLSSHIPGTGTSQGAWISRSETDSVLLACMDINHRYLEIAEIPVIAGAAFDETGSRDQIIVNQQFVEFFGYATPLDAVGGVVQCDGEDLQISGVVQDFHYLNLEEPIRPFFFRFRPEACHYVNARIIGADPASTMLAVKSAWTRMDPQRELMAWFTDDYIRRYNSFMIDHMRIFGYGAFVLLAIACLGLLGITLYAIESKSKELGIRKVFGANTWDLVYLSSKGFVTLILLAGCIGIPIGLFLYGNLVKNFVYHIDIGIGTMTHSIVFLALLAIVFVGVQALYTSRRNPIESLRSE